MSSQSFADLGVSKRGGRRASARAASTEPFPVQRLVVPDVLAGHDVLAKSPTGSGKTLAFGIPMVDRIEAGRPAPARARPRRPPASWRARSSTSCATSPRPRALDRRRLRRRRHRAPEPGGAQGAHPRRHARPARGPDGARRRVAAIRSGSSSSTRPTGCSTWASARPSTGSSARRRDERQTLFFSATLDGEVGQLANAYTTDARRHEHAATPSSAGDVEHRFVAVRHEDKLDAPGRASCGDERGARTLVFVRTKRGADRLVKRLRAHDVTARRHARQQVPVPAREGAGPLRARRRRHARRHRRRRPRPRRRRHHARDQLRRARPTTRATSTASAAPAAPGAPGPASRSSSADQAQRRGEDRPRPVAALGVRPAAAGTRPPLARASPPALLRHRALARLAALALRLVGLLVALGDPLLDRVQRVSAGRSAGTGWFTRSVMCTPHSLPEGAPQTNAGTGTLRWTGAQALYASAARRGVARPAARA